MTLGSKIEKMLWLKLGDWPLYPMRQPMIEMWLSQTITTSRTLWEKLDQTLVLLLWSDSCQFQSCCFENFFISYRYQVDMVLCWGPKFLNTLSCMNHIVFLIFKYLGLINSLRLLKKGIFLTDRSSFYTDFKGTLSGKTRSDSLWIPCS